MKACRFALAFAFALVLGANLVAATEPVVRQTSLETEAPSVSLLAKAFSDLYRLLTQDYERPALRHNNVSTSLAKTLDVSADDEVAAAARLHKLWAADGSQPRTADAREVADPTTTTMKARRRLHQISVSPTAG